MPTYAFLPQFWRDWEALTPEQQDAVLAMKEKFVQDLAAGRFRKGLRVKLVKGTEGIYEVTWAMGAIDGRATFHYGDEVHVGQPHVVWRHVGTHAIFSNP